MEKIEYFQGNIIKQCYEAMINYEVENRRLNNK